MEKLQHLIETYSVSKKDIRKISLTEDSNKILIENKEFSINEAFQFPQWRLDQKNLNGRIYTTALANKIVKENKTTFALMNHPSDKSEHPEGSVKDIWAIQKDPFIDKGILWFHVYLVGTWGKGLIKDILDLGEGVPLSSSGYGDVLKNGTVDVNTYELERYADFVLNPSYQVYGFAEYNESIENKDDNILEEENKKDILKRYKTYKESGSSDKEALDKVSNDLGINEESITKIIEIDNDNTIKEGFKSMPTNKKFSVEEKSFKYQVKNLIKEAEEKEDPQEKKAAYEEIHEWFREVEYAPDLKKEVEDKLEDLDKQIKELAKKGIKTDSLIESETILKTNLNEMKNSLKDISEKYDIACSTLDSLKVFSNKMRDLYENQKAKTNGMVSADILKEYIDKVDILQNSLNESNEKLNELTKEKCSLKESLDTVQKKYDDKIKLDKIKEQQVILEREAILKKIEEDKEIERKKINELKLKELIEKENNSVIKNNNSEVVEYYRDLENSNSNFKVIREDILRCKTLVEAQQTALRLKGLVEGNYVKSTTPVLKNVEEGRHSNKITEDSRSFKKRKDWI